MRIVLYFPYIKEEIGGMVVDDKKKLYPKEDCVQKACEEVQSMFTEELNTIYKDIERKMREINPENQASFVVNQEKILISGMVNRQISEMRNIFINAICQVSKAGQEDERAYSDSQAVLMWQTVTARLDAPALDYPEINPAENGGRVSQRSVIFDILKKNFKQISKELKQSSVGELECEKVKDQLKGIINKYDPSKKNELVKFVKWKKENMGDVMIQPSVTNDDLQRREKKICDQLKSWIDRVGDKVFKEEPIL